MRRAVAERKKFVEGSRALVTGVSGLLGGNFAFQASQQYQLTGIYGAHRVVLPGMDCLSLHLAEKHEVGEILKKVRPEIIFHFAAVTNVDWCEDHEPATHETNVEGTRNLAQWAADNDALMVFMSTDSVFDGERGAYRESDSPNPLNVYARSKFSAEEVVRKLCQRHLIIRGNIYGWNIRRKSSIAEWVLGRLENGDTVPGFTDAIFAPLLVNSLADVILVLVRRGAIGTLHAASRDAVSKFDFAVEIARQFCFNPASCERHLAINAGFRARRPLNTALDATKATVEYRVSFPSVAEDIARFKALRDQGYAARLRNCSTSDS